METRSPSVVRIFTMVLFALSCVGLLMFLWLSFGGTLPFNAVGYEVKASFPYADQLAPQADVRIAGVTVGKVIGKSLDPQGNRTVATLQIQNKYAPLHKDARAILRLKTILGETYVEITPGSSSAPPVPDNTLLPRGQVVPAVQLDQVLNTFDPTTRQALRSWQRYLAAVLRGNDQNLNDVLGNLPSFAGNADDVLKILDVEHQAVVGLLQNGGTVFNAIARDPTALRNLITSGETTFATTAAVNTALADSIRQFPEFLTQTRLTLGRLQSFSTDTDPLIRQLVPVAAQLTPTLRDVRTLSPDLRRLFTKLGPLITVSKPGLPALQRVLGGATPLLGAVGPFLSQLNPIVTWLSLHQQVVSDFVSAGAPTLMGTTVAFGGGSTGHYLRQFSPIGPETLALSNVRDPYNRGNTYPSSLWLGDPMNLVHDIAASFDCKNTGAPGNGEIAANGIPAPLGRPACWIQQQLPGAPSQYQIPRITAASYSRK
jgi:phospholipid/cholesterol/gamma-HCH transport system substrate-binding protein